MERRLGTVRSLSAADGASKKTRCRPELAPASDPDPALNMVFFKPVEGSMLHLTVMGASLSRFELLIQQYAPVDYSMDPGSVVPRTVQLVPRRTNAPVGQQVDFGARVASCVQLVPHWLRVTFQLAAGLERNRPALRCDSRHAFRLKTWDGPGANVADAAHGDMAHMEMFPLYTLSNPRPHQASTLLCTMAIAGAFWASPTTFYVEPDDDSAGFDYLQRHGLEPTSVQLPVHASTQF